MDKLKSVKTDAKQDIDRFSGDAFSKNRRVKTVMRKTLENLRKKLKT